MKKSIQKLLSVLLIVCSNGIVYGMHQRGGGQTARRRLDFPPQATPAFMGGAPDKSEAVDPSMEEPTIYRLQSTSTTQWLTVGHPAQQQQRRPINLPLPPSDRFDS